MPTPHPAGPYNLLKVVFGLPVTPSSQSCSYSVRDLLANTTPDPITGCMIWKGKQAKSGYAIIPANSHWLYVHRLIAFYSQIAHPGWRAWLASQPYIHVCHTCDNPPCINPFHLVIATGQANAWDSQAKGRRALKDRKTLGLETYSELLQAGQIVNLDQLVPRPSSAVRSPSIPKGKPRDRINRAARLASLLDP